MPQQPSSLQPAFHKDISTQSYLRRNPVLLPEAKRISVPIWKEQGLFLQSICSSQMGQGQWPRSSSQLKTEFSLWSSWTPGALHYNAQMDTVMDPANFALQIVLSRCLSGGHSSLSLQWYGPRANGYQCELLQPRATYAKLRLHGRRGHKSEKTFLSNTVVSEDRQARQSQRDPRDEE